jgi:hypothetical protein
VSNRQLIILGSFALACCLVVGLTFRVAGLKAAPLTDDKPSPGRYQMVGVQQGDQPYLIILDTSTGITWYRRLQGNFENPDGWNPITSPALPHEPWTHISVSEPTGTDPHG